MYGKVPNAGNLIGQEAAATTSSAYKNIGHSSVAARFSFLHTHYGHVLL